MSTEKSYAVPSFMFRTASPNFRVNSSAMSFST
ncbi:Uncharacterised protein [Mycobacterium tuberculosis]|uniref:Uncharacterized protein n=1 Tax=Mycobacterium tuberculosis TaxID=1773 RepID=A0A655FJY9_MYCTX|nr:Uncharacterised protein [Mycobacterium tuberculosis]CKQ60909.1 Uncharacterised protein [Mycobacterium tuberculosis]CKT31522.1 Uncharacterised protein [Mycobacterium tuberculosis]CKT75900.1 Uncharacterised protein [Mycobacterium tuberculosis]CKV74236.1 Uncharacterised protein [Mycobacterium tuberculosis]